MCFLWLVNTLCLFSLQAGDSTDDPHHQTLLEVVFCVAVRTEHGSLNVVMLDVELMCFYTLPPLGCCDQRVSRTCWVCPSPRFSVSVSLCFSLSLSVLSVSLSQSPSLSFSFWALCFGKFCNVFASTVFWYVLLECSFSKADERDFFFKIKGRKKKGSWMIKIEKRE